MKILLIGNYTNSRQQSMQLFAELMHRHLSATGHDVRLVRPPVILSRLRSGETGLAKWVGYIDRFLLYPFLLRWQIRWADVVHICDHANAVYIPHLRGKPHVVTCHDMLAIRSALGEISDNPTRWSGRIYQRWILKNLRKAQKVICVSRRTQDEIKRVAGLDSSRVMIVPNSINYHYRPMATEEAVSRLQTLGLDVARPFFLHVGGNQWYKNRTGVLRIFSKLAQSLDYRKHYLVMVGKPWTGEVRQLAQSLALEMRTVELVDVLNEDLCALYSVAEALLFPSLQEGFGWPIIEAQACGCPVITTDRPPMTDVGGHAAIYIDPSDIDGAVKNIAKGLVEREQLRALGLKNAAHYSPEAMIGAYVELYQAVVMGHPSSWRTSTHDEMHSG